RARAARAHRREEPSSAEARDQDAVHPVALLRRAALAARLALGLHAPGDVPRRVRQREARGLLRRDGREGAPRATRPRGRRPPAPRARGHGPAGCAAARAGRGAQGDRRSRRAQRHAARERQGARAGLGGARLVDILLLGIYSFFVWLIFIKLKWLPWNTVSQVIVVIIPVVALTIMILVLNVVAPTSSDVRVIKYVVNVVPQVRGRVLGARRRQPGD